MTESMDAVRATENRFWFLKKCPLFDSLSDEEMGALKRSGRQIDVFRLNQDLPLTGLEDSIFLVKMGYLKVVRRSSSGKKESILFLGPGDVFQPAGSREIGEAEERFRTVTPVCLLQFNRDIFAGFVHQYPNVAYTLMKVSLFRIQKLEVRLAETALLSPEARLAKALVELSTAWGEDPASGDRGSEIRLTQGDLAKLIGTSREFVSRVLSSFRERGWVVTTGRTISIRNREILLKLGGTP